MSDLHLFIGNKCFSSWSLRPWLALKELGIPFRETVIRLRQTDTKANIRALARADKVPCLHHGSLVIWESLAILEYVAELAPAKKLWPADTEARAMARSIATEMHGGFADLRNEWGMNLRRRKSPKPLQGPARDQAQRIEDFWRRTRAKFGQTGPFLFGNFTAADAMYAPVVTRFDTYGGNLAADTRAYCDAVLGTGGMREWYAGAAVEPWPEPDPEE
ncbi:MAG: glutathione S-transferase family protein [Pseudomonadota bacterium]|nr:glutathione S-transferase family protein [Pseudomonadota bacterium]